MMKANSVKKARAMISRPEWEKKLAEVSVKKEDLNKLVMNYLVIEGYKDAAEKFSRESGISPNIDLTSIEDRMNIRNAIQSGDVDGAIEKVNDLDPEVKQRMTYCSFYF